MVHGKLFISDITLIARYKEKKKDKKAGLTTNPGKKRAILND
jgi:hypothetical protein